ncbi:MAG: cysteine protease [Ignavibacteria bacterium GWB2_35_12]|nr:MAG: cysteine protease [Ignavibacteria bacterium GWB2_35_12]OGU86324.1 MAG: cysteine protease [Ignavibacteria bacterium RIFOXYA2_FULL_35_10]OGV20090.1 MAG: cysteine protease [Ignavibacteria bacterium RIFOXYC2_FULL_35_21]
MYNLYKKVHLLETGETVGTGWLPQMPDLNDYTLEHSKIKDMVSKIKINSDNLTLPSSVDLREWCSPIENQLNLGSCSAHAAVGLVEYFEKKVNGKFIEGCHLFLYKTTRNLMQLSGDTGAWLRNAMSALVLFGVPNEKYLPYSFDGKFVNPNWDNEPNAFLYSLANNYKTVKYFCHDPQGSIIPTKDVLSTVKQYLAAGIPSMFGFWGFPSFNNSNIPGGIPYPCQGEYAQWGHAVATVGYDDNKKIINTKNNKETTGALLIRNSWGNKWGENGFGWLPYNYIINKLACDFWSLISMDWVDSGQFGI